MTRSNQILAIVLAVQLVLAAFIVLRSDSDDAQTNQIIFADFDPESITQIDIQDIDGNTIALAKQDDAWVLPNADDFPANATTVTSLLNKIKDLTSREVIAREESSHNRLEVGEDEYNRLVTLTAADGSQQRLYIGSSAGFNATHIRANDDDEVYLVADLTATDAGTQMTSWINTQYISNPSEQITHVRLENVNGVFEFTKEGDAWTMQGLAEGETFNADAFNSFLTSVAAVRMTEPLGKTEQDDYAMGTPQATLTVTIEEPQEPEGTPDPNAITPPTVETITKEITLVVGATRENGYVVKSSDSEYYVQVATFTGDNFAKKVRTDFLVVPEATPTPTPQTEIFGG